MPGGFSLDLDIITVEGSYPVTPAGGVFYESQNLFCKSKAKHLERCGS